MQWVRLDPDDYSRVSQYRWSTDSGGFICAYSKYGGRKAKGIKCTLARYVFLGYRSLADYRKGWHNPAAVHKVSHLNGDSFDFRKCNLVPRRNFRAYLHIGEVGRYYIKRKK